MLDQIIEASGNAIPHLLDAGVTDLIIYGIGFIGFCILGSLLTRKDRKANPEKYARMSAAYNEEHSSGTVIIDGQAHIVHRAGNVTHIY